MFWGREWITQAGLSATFGVGGTLTRVGGEIDSFLMGLLIRILKNVKK